MSECRETQHGYVVGQTTIEKYMIRAPKKPGDTWRSSIQRHMDVTAACDFFVVLSHRRRIIHINVTTNPTAEWTAQQIGEPQPNQTGAAHKDPAPRAIGSW